MVDINKIRGDVQKVKEGEQSKFMINIRRNKEDVNSVSQLTSETKDVLDTELAFKRHKEQEKSKQKEQKGLTMG